MGSRWSGSGGGIAAEAGVSAALVMHHYGSKDNLRVACDRHVAALVREAKQEAVAAGTGMDATAQLRAFDDGAPLLRYLARSLVDGSPHVADLVDEMVTDAVGYIRQAVDNGLMTPSDDPHGRAAGVLRGQRRTLLLWSLALPVVTTMDMDVAVTGVLAGGTGLFLLGLAYGAIAYAVGAASGRRSVGLGVAAAGAGLVAFERRDLMV